MRDGKKVGTYPIDAIDNNRLIALMVGRDNTERFPKADSAIGEVCLEVKHLTSPNPRSFRDISFELRKGEILGVGGLVGAQRTELVEAIFGVRSIASGQVLVNGKPLKRTAPKSAIHAGIGFITEDRRTSGIFPLLDITKNTAIAALGDYRNMLGLLRHARINADAERYNQKLRTKTPAMNTVIQNLSGGNQQKVILSRWLMTLPDILIMDEPTRGIDVGAKYEIYTIMGELVREGKSIIMVSSEMPELLGMSHRIMVLCDGRLTGILPKEEATQEKVMTLATQFS
jgi:methyl-galactoside transport system ATP-binding protein